MCVTLQATSSESGEANVLPRCVVMKPCLSCADTKAKTPVPLKALLKLSTNFTIIILGKVTIGYKQISVFHGMKFIPPFSVLANLLALAALGFFTPTMQPFLLGAVSPLHTVVTVEQL